jgi:oligopeptide transport system permease protein
MGTSAPAISSTVSYPTVRDAPDRLWRRVLTNGRVLIGGGMLLLILGTCLATLPWTLSTDSKLHFDAQRAVRARTAPSLSEPVLYFGSDELGRSLFGRCMIGGVISLAVGVAAAAISVVLGVTVGLISGFRGGWVDALLMRFVDVMYGLPYLLQVILLKIAFERQFDSGNWTNAGALVLGVFFFVAGLLIFQRRATAEERPRQRLSWTLMGLGAGSAAIGALSWMPSAPLPRLGANLLVLFIAIGLVSWLTMARVVRGQVLSLRSQPFIEAARAAGLPEWRIFLRHLLPNLAGPIIVYATLTVPQAVLQESFLSFLGIGVQAPMPTWGSLAADGIKLALNPLNPRWWFLLFPCTLLALTLLSLNFVGDGLRDLFDPKKEAAKL